MELNKTQISVFKRLIPIYVDFMETNNNFLDDVGCFDEFPEIKHTNLVVNHRGMDYFNALYERLDKLDSKKSKLTKEQILDLLTDNGKTPEVVARFYMRDFLFTTKEFIHVLVSIGTKYVENRFEDNPESKKEFPKFKKHMDQQEKEFSELVSMLYEHFDYDKL